MKPTELMIGDWVSYNGHPVLVEALNKSNGYVIEKDMISIKLNDDTCLDINAERLEPLPFTNEILEKIGFTGRRPYFGDKEYISDFHVMLRSWTNGKSFNFHFYEVNFGRDCWFPYPVQCVHELQHYFKDCKIEKKIVL